MQRTSLFFFWKPSEWKSGLLICVSTTLGLTAARGFPIVFLVKSLFCYRYIILLPEAYKWVTDALLRKSEICCFKCVSKIWLLLSLCMQSDLSALLWGGANTTWTAVTKAACRRRARCQILQVKERTSSMTMMNASESYTLWKISIGTAQSIKQNHRICLVNLCI